MHRRFFVRAVHQHPALPAGQRPGGLDGRERPLAISRRDVTRPAALGAKHDPHRLAGGELTLPGGEALAGLDALLGSKSERALEIYDGWFLPVIARVELVLVWLCVFSGVRLKNNNNPCIITIIILLLLLLL
jgi:hypothetical protein